MPFTERAELCVLKHYRVESSSERLQHVGVYGSKSCKKMVPDLSVGWHKRLTAGMQTLVTHALQSLCDMFDDLAGERRQQATKL